MVHSVFRYLDIFSCLYTVRLKDSSCTAHMGKWGQRPSDGYRIKWITKSGTHICKAVQDHRKPSPNILQTTLLLLLLLIILLPWINFENVVDSHSGKKNVIILNVQVYRTRYRPSLSCYFILFLMLRRCSQCPGKSAQTLLLSWCCQESLYSIIPFQIWHV